MSAKRRLVIVGASGAGRRVLDIALDMVDSRPGLPFTHVAVVDDSPTSDNIAKLESYGVPYIGTCQDWFGQSEPDYFSIGVGDTRARAALADAAVARGHEPMTLVAPTARISRTSRVGPGSVISPGVDISANAQIGRFTHVMANSAVSHDAVVGDFVNVNPGAVIAGNCALQDHVTLGAGAVVIQGLTLGRGAVVGAAACVIQDVPPASTVKGVPAR